ncbi:MAG: restriction endonuclease subunit S [Limnobacter sp.]|nr:restriction endonuclease subunit S [Limnobacter sp.]
MSKWQQTTLGKIVKLGGGKIQTGPFGSQLHASDYVDQGIPCIMPANMKNNQVDLSGIAMISELDAKRLSQHLVNDGDIVYSRRGDVTQKALISKKEEGYFCGTGCLLVRPGKNIDPEFLTYHLSTPSNQSWIVNQAVGATMPNLNTTILSNVPLNVPDKVTQQKIAAALSALDSRIECNNRINVELEEMAKALYDYWFVQFDFPDSNGKPYKSSGGKMVYNATLKRAIPEGWGVEALLKSCEVIDCLHSKKPKFAFEDQHSYLLQLENLLDNGQIDLTKKYFVTKDDYKLWTSRIEVKKNDIVMTNAGRIAAFAQIPSDVKCGIGRNITTLRPVNILPNFFYLSLSSQDIKIQILNNLDQGAFFKSFNVKGMKSLNLLRPSYAIEELFEKKITPIIEKRHLVAAENSVLSKLRDWLLPLLMNGQVTVE